MMDSVSMNQENKMIVGEKQEVTEDSLESVYDIKPSSASSINKEAMSADTSNIDSQSSFDRWLANRNTNKEEQLQGGNIGDEALIQPTNEKLKQKLESLAATEIHSQGKKETAPQQVFGSGHDGLRIQCTTHTLKEIDIEKEKDDQITRGHELYLRYILLLLKAAHLALKGFLCKKVKDRNGNLADLIIEKKDAFENSYKEETELLFKEDGVNTNIESWDTRLLCVVILVMFHLESDLQRTVYEAVKCILDHLRDLDNYVQSASLDYNTFEAQWKSLHDAIIELINDIDKKAEYECIRMIHSYELGSISISPEVIRNLKKTHDVKMHANIALQNKVDLQHGNQGFCDQNQPGKRQNDYIKFTEKLQDKFVYADDSAVLTCELNVSEENVTWRHNNKQIKDSNTIKTLTDGCCQWLAISRAKLEDAGLYTCVCCNVSTKAYLKVSEKPLIVTKDLHVATEDTNVTENMDIVLVCKVSHHATNVTWRHRGEVINSKRHHILLDGNVHKLTILKAQYEDEGEYTVDFGTSSSRTEIILKGQISLAHRAQLTNDLYKNWIRGALGLKYLKLGLEDVSRCIVEKHHSELLVQLSSIGVNSVPCTQCKTDRLLPAHPQQTCPKKPKCICSKQRHNRQLCPNGGFCSNLFDKIMYDHRFNDPVLSNTDIQKWANDPWSVAKCYITTLGYRDKSSEKEIDCTGLLSLFINNTFFERSLNHIEVNGETDVFQKARDTRNDILHNANYELSKGQLHNYLDLFTSVLEVKDVNDKQALSSYPGTKKAIDNLNELKNNEIYIRISGELQKQIQELKEHAMTDIAEHVEQATKQKNLKVQHLEERLTENEKELQLLRNVRSIQTERKDKVDSQAVFKLDLQLQVIEPTGESSTQGNLRIFQSMNNFNSGQNMKTDEHSSPTDGSLQRLLEYIKVLKNCQVAEISNANAVVVVTVNCSACNAIETFLKLINGNEFQRELIELRKCLQLHDYMNIDDVVVSCSSESLEKTRKSLPKQIQIKSFTCKKHILECTWYCPDHDEFFCPKCKDVDHGRCDGLKQVITDRSYSEQKQSLILKRKIGKHDVRINNILFNMSDNDDVDCHITSIRMLPNGEILLVDYRNKKLKKLDRTLNIVSHCDLPDIPLDVCYTGNDRAAVCACPNVIQYVHVSGNMKLEERISLGHKCYGLACYDETLYVRGSDTIYRYNKEFQYKRYLCSYRSDNLYALYRHMAVSDDGEIIYISNGYKGLTTIDKEGNRLSTLTTDETKFHRDVFVLGGTVLVVDSSGSVYQVDNRGERVLGTVISSASGSHFMKTLCFDRLKCRLLMAGEVNSIAVFKLKMHSTC